MTPQQWEKLLAVIGGELLDPLPSGFVIDSPWLPGWASMSILDYYSSEQMWLDANFKAVDTFADTMFLPGFWSEYGMCTEPSAFGAKSRFHEDEFPHADKVVHSITDIAGLSKPNPATDGLLPFVIKRLANTRPKIEAAGHQIKFAVSRGPLNIASFLMGTTEFLMAIRTDPDETHRLLQIVTNFTVDWLKLQKQTFPTIDAIFILDDIVGFLGKDDFETAAMPYLKPIFEAFDCAVRFFHNDAGGTVCAPYLPDLGVNLFNFSHNHPISEIKQLTKNKVTLLGNIPPRDVLASGTPDQVQQSVKDILAEVEDKSGIILSCGGGMPPNVPTENIKAFLQAIP